MYPKYYWTVKLHPTFFNVFLVASQDYYYYYFFSNLQTMVNTIDIGELSTSLDIDLFTFES